MHLQQAVHNGVWFLLHDNDSLDSVIESLALFSQIASEKSKVTKDDIFGEADDIELKDDARLETLPTEIDNIKTESLWSKQFLVLFAMWQFPGLLALVVSHSSQNVANFLLNDFLTIMSECMCGTSITPAQKGAKTEILAHALSPLETVCYVVKVLQLAHYHNPLDNNTPHAS